MTNYNYPYISLREGFTMFHRQQVVELGGTIDTLARLLLLTWW
jgi:hypothetical protein